MAYITPYYKGKGGKGQHNMTLAQELKLKQENMSGDGWISLHNFPQFKDKLMLENEEIKNVANHNYEEIM